MSHLNVPNGCAPLWPHPSNKSNGALETAYQEHTIVWVSENVLAESFITRVIGILFCGQAAAFFACPSLNPLKVHSRNDVCIADWVNCIFSPHYNCLSQPSLTWGNPTNALSLFGFIPNDTATQPETSLSQTLVPSSWLHYSHQLLTTNCIGNTHILITVKETLVSQILASFPGPVQLSVACSTWVTSG